jgi:hypothetical protein
MTFSSCGMALHFWNFLLRGLVGGVDTFVQGDSDPSEKFAI